MLKVYILGYRLDINLLKTRSTFYKNYILLV